MDVVIDGFMRRFRSEHGLDGLSDVQLFEAFATYCVVRKYYKGDLAVDECLLGGLHGVTGGAVLVNGVMFTDPHDLKEHLISQSVIDARFVLIQAKPAETLARDTFTELSRAVQLLFGAQPMLTATTPQLDRFRQCIEIVYSERTRFRSDSPIISALCVTPGRPSSGRLSTTPSAVARELKEMNLFAAVEVELVDADQIRTLFHRAYAPLEASLRMSDHIALPRVDGVFRAYLGIALGQHLVQDVLADARGHVRAGLFYDNVRGFLQRTSPVNMEMENTLRSDSRRSRFAVMNNGITIVTHDLDISDEGAFALRGFCVVNGCQTCHVLVGNRDRLAEDVTVTVRVIVTTDDSVIDDVVHGSNRQTVVALPTFDARQPFQRELEDYFAAQPGVRQLLYERRLGQYGHGIITREALPLSATPAKTKSAGLPRSRIMTPGMVARALVSAFKSEAWRASSPGAAFPERVIFRSAPAPDPLPFYTAASILFRVDDLLRNRKIPALFRTARYHMVSAAKCLLVGGDPLPADGQARAALCEKILDVTWDPVRSLSLFDSAMAVLRRARDEAFPNGEADFSARMTRSQEFSTHVVRVASEMRIGLWN